MIEDAAQAIGSLYYNKPSGSFGKVGCFSTNPIKNLNSCGDGGFLTTNDKNIYKKAEILNKESWNMAEPYDRYMGINNKSIINDSVKVISEYSGLQWEDLELNEKENFAKNISDDLYWKQLPFPLKQDLVDIEYSLNHLNQNQATELDLISESEQNEQLIEWGRYERVLPNIKHFLTVQ